MQKYLRGVSLMTGAQVNLSSLLSDIRVSLLEFWHSQWIRPKSEILTLRLHSQSFIWVELGTSEWSPTWFKPQVKPVFFWSRLKSCVMERTWENVSSQTQSCLPLRLTWNMSTHVPWSNHFALTTATTNCPLSSLPPSSTLAGPPFQAYTLTPQ
jgi:hypothetical protein